MIAPAEPAGEASAVESPQDRVEQVRAVVVGAHAQQRERDHRRVRPGGLDDLRHLRVDVAVGVEHHSLVAPRLVPRAVRLAEHDDRRVELVGGEHVEERARARRGTAPAQRREERIGVDDARAEVAAVPRGLDDAVARAMRGADTPPGNPCTATRLPWAWCASQSATMTLPFPSPSGDFGRSNTTNRLPCSASRPQNGGNGMADTRRDTQS